MPNSFRKLLLLEENKFLISKIQHLINAISGHWLTFSNDENLIQLTDLHCEINKAKQILGQEFKHAIFDARTQFNLDALAILTGTLKAGSLLILIINDDLKNWQDLDSFRWNDTYFPIKVPFFVTHLKKTLNKQFAQFKAFTYRLSAHHQTELNFITKQITTQNENIIKREHFNEQQTLLKKIIKIKSKIILITAKRGRGKSALAGMYTHFHDCIITAPSKNSAVSLLKFANNQAKFYAPDDLINLIKKENLTNVKLIIDEAAMIPMQILQKLIIYFRQILITTTTEGYEGTGQGLLLKLLAPYFTQNEIKHFTLIKPIRWAKDDPLEYFIDELCATSVEQKIEQIKNSLLIMANIDKQSPKNSLDAIIKLFKLLKEAHYRTTLSDFRRFLDATDTNISYIKKGEQVVSALICVNEGNLDDALINEVLKGNRRPKGNLVAQSLTAHAFTPLAAKLKSIRINRIATALPYQNQGFASTLITQIIANAKNNLLDFVSVSFAYNKKILSFWHKQRFTVVHIGSNQDASSGCYAIMAIYPISTKGFELQKMLTSRLARNWLFEHQHKNIKLSLAIEQKQILDNTDLKELCLFSRSNYSLIAVTAALHRLVISQKILYKKDQIQEILPISYQFVENKGDLEITKNKLKLTSKKNVINALRSELNQFLRQYLANKHNKNEGHL